MTSIGVSSDALAAVVLANDASVLSMSPELNRFPRGDGPSHTGG